MLPGVVALLAASDRFAERARDWRAGAVVYQVFVDRFGLPDDPTAKRGLYPTPLRGRNDTPHATPYDPRTKGYPHTLEFWGGDLPGLRARLGYVRDLGADVLYLQPIFKAPSNHKYDTEDYFRVDPQLGTEGDLRALVADLHAGGMRLVLDGVFNHVGATSPLFRDPAKRDWFFFDPALPNGYRGWAGVASLPAFRLENPAVRRYLWGGPDSVVRHYLDLGIDGWRLDVAFELGPAFLREITEAAHAARPGSLVVGEISGYPAGWAGTVDGVFDFSPLALGRAMLDGATTGGTAGRALGHLVEDAGIEGLLRSWLLVENHDTPRLASLIPDPAARRIVTALQMTLPGSPCVYYGEELGLEGAGDPENRAPFPWARAATPNPERRWFTDLLKLRKSRPALRIGDLTPLDTDRLLAFVRTTDRTMDATIVVVNPTGATVRESFATRVGRLMSWGELQDGLTGRRVKSINGLVDVEMPPRSVAIFAPVADRSNGYSPYDRVP